MQVKRFRIAIYGLLVSGNKVLMTETKVPSGSFFNFPGGGLELGEAPRRSLEREFQEETGLGIEIDELLFCSEAFHQNPDYPDEQVYHVYYRVRQKGNAEKHIAVASGEILQIQWFGIDQIPQTQMWRADLELLESAEFKKLFKNG